MSQGGKNRWDVSSIREYERNGETKTQWTKIGVAFTNQNGSINVQLDCLPLDGKCQLQVPLTQEEKDRLFGPRQDRGGGGQQRQEGRQNQNHRPPQGQGYGRQQQGNPRNAGAQQRQGAAQRYGQRGQSQPQGSFPQTQQQYAPDPNESEGDYSQVPEGEGWDVDGVWIVDPRKLPRDHPDFLPF